MFRTVSLFFLLLAYVAGTGHCVVMSAACLENDGGSCHFPAEENEVGDIGDPGARPCAGHAPHGVDCEVESMLAAPSAFGALARLLPPPAEAAGFAGVIGRFAVLFRAVPDVPRECVLFRRDWDCVRCLARGWQFMTRAAAPARAPSVVVFAR
ncbi:MAG: hypothetical protein LBD14_02320 [Puniceicoccales bacterium]|jgi:hypothetical protein|nr:hypothetical protein [Puniceicoccales bacterium]